MSNTDVKAYEIVEPKIYGYSTPGITYHDGFLKIGYTENDVEKRVREQTRTAGIRYNIEMNEDAVYKDGNAFKDHQFHSYLRIVGVKQPNTDDSNFPKNPHSEWFKISPKEAKSHLNDFKINRGHPDIENISFVRPVTPYTLRNEQKNAVSQTKEYYIDNKDNEPEFLWNAKPRFGKTLTVYDFCKKMDAKKVLILTNRPSIANSWYNDYVSFLGTDSGYYFISEVDDLKNREGVYSRTTLPGSAEKYIEFISLQNLKGASECGGKYEKLEHISKLEWDILVIDEAHEGIDTVRTDFAFDNIKRKFTLHLSGTPFKALAKEKFEEKAIFNWTYADEQRAKREWNPKDGENPYQDMPQLNLFTYQMSEIVKDEIKKGMKIDGKDTEYAFDLNEFFAVNDNGTFKHNDDVDKFLLALTTETKFPFSTEELRKELKHTMWLMDRVDAVKALVKKLEKHPVFKDYKIINATGNGKTENDCQSNEKAYDKVIKEIRKNDKTITLSVGQLTTGVTIPEWTAVLMLSNVKSPALYMQAAFRAQNPCLLKSENYFYRKKNAYVFDFDPARSLIIFEEFANNLSKNTYGGKGNTEEREKNISELLNFFPVIAETEDGMMCELDAEKVLVIPRKIKSKEVVSRCFMCNYLFQNTNNIFGAQKIVMNILNNLKYVKEGEKINITDDEIEDLSLDSEGNVSLPPEIVIGKEKDIFGDKIYKITDSIADNISPAVQKNDIQKMAKDIKSSVNSTIIDSIINTAKESYDNSAKSASDAKKITAALDGEAASLKKESDALIDKVMLKYNRDKNQIENERQKAISDKDKTGMSSSEINSEFDNKLKKLHEEFKTDLNNRLTDFTEKAAEETVKTVETQIREKQKNTFEEDFRGKLRDFSRTIPAFLMAYGDYNTTLENFDKIIPEDVFKEVTSISLAEFRFLRDGGDYTDEETGEKKHFKGQLFDKEVFNDSVKEFLNLKNKLANYFENDSKEDIFDYIPPQETNQIFTPKKVVKEMVDMLEKENPGCFDNPDKTFIDLYMKSGLYIAEIVRRLFISPEMKNLFPDDDKRLTHIFAKQVFGLAPTEIIYRIVISFVLGFDKDNRIKKHNLKLFDSLPAAKNGTLDKEIDRLFS